MKARIEDFNPIMDMPGFFNIWVWEWNEKEKYHDAWSKDERMVGLPWRMED